jgi:SM-20-related protein
MLSGLNMRVIDGLMPPGVQSSLIDCISWMPLHFVNRWERFKSHELDMHWYYPFAFAEEPYTGDAEPALQALDETLLPIKQCWEHVKAALDGPVRLYECVLSANTFGTEGRVHQDIADESLRSKHCTALVYLNREWELAWAGETLVFDDKGEVTGAVVPKPGRVAIIWGDPLHVGRAVSRTCPTDRRVLVFKLWALP